MSDHIYLRRASKRSSTNFTRSITFKTCLTLIAFTPAPTLMNEIRMKNINTPSKGEIKTGKVKVLTLPATQDWQVGPVNLPLHWQLPGDTHLPPFWHPPEQIGELQSPPDLVWYIVSSITYSRNIDRAAISNIYIYKSYHPPAQVLHPEPIQLPVHWQVLGDTQVPCWHAGVHTGVWHLVPAHPAMQVSHVLPVILGSSQLQYWLGFTQEPQRQSGQVSRSFHFWACAATKASIA